jgi:hypothetical protein
MAHPKAMGIGAMFVLLVVAVVVLPMIVHYVERMEPHFVVSGFQDLAAGGQRPATQSDDAVHVPPQASLNSMSKMYHPDPNTSYLCRAPNGSDRPCPEGTFCDGLTQSCVSNYPGGNVPDIGYYS